MDGQRATYSHLVVQLPFDINFRWSLGYIKFLETRGVCLPGENMVFHSWFVCSQHTVPRNIKLAQTLPSQSTN